VPAGALSSVLLAGFIGLMWRGGPPPEAIAPPAVAPAPQTTSVPSVPPASADPSLTAKQAVPTELLQKTQPTAAAPTQGTAAAEVVAAAPSMAESRSASASMPSALARQQASTASASPSMKGSADAMGAPSVPPDPLAAMVVAWSAGGPESAAPQRWWEALRDRTQGRWRDAEPVEGADSLLLAGPAGEPLGRLRWEPAAVRWQAAGDDRGWRAELSAGEIEQLRRTMPR
jgi:hypothetical protein